MALKDLIHILYYGVFFALLPDMVRALQPPYEPDISWIVQLLGVLGGIAVIVVFVIGVYFCYNKCSLNPTPGIVVTVTGNDTRTIVTSGNTAQEHLPIEQYPY
uniref:Uncharacterized protein LOC111135272 n=1 Tax=Crassostrea virginica TaxID=6565 RepID=A0A8B8ELW4_CRAVI|nr:uncharacterized protein LOC111135272 [Crassostrea virginica]